LLIHLGHLAKIAESCMHKIIVFIKERLEWISSSKELSENLVSMTKREVGSTPEPL
jgi:hypothetical protein